MFLAEADGTVALARREFDNDTVPRWFELRTPPVSTFLKRFKGSESL